MSALRISFGAKPDQRLNFRIGRISHAMSPGFGWCYRCLTTWNFVRHHTTPYGDAGSGCFPLCEKCWSDLAIPEARMPYYERMIADWSNSGYPPEKPDQIRTAVLAGR